MTLEETRQLGIEFERRILTMIPETEIVAKLDTETIYSYLNQYQDKFVYDVYRAMDSVESPSNISARVELMLQGLLKSQDIQLTAKESSMNLYSVTLPEDFGLYLNSTSTLDSSYQYKRERPNKGVVHNVLFSNSDFNKLIHNPSDTMRIIREPVCTVHVPRTLEVLYDRYTAPSKFTIEYYKIPKYMDLMTSTPCELPMEVFDDLVSGAVDLYVQYAAGAEARKRQQQELLRLSKKQDNE